MLSSFRYFSMCFIHSYYFSSTGTSVYFKVFFPCCPKPFPRFFTLFFLTQIILFIVTPSSPGSISFFSCYVSFAILGMCFIHSSCCCAICSIYFYNKPFVLSFALFLLISSSSLSPRLLLVKPRFLHASSFLLLDFCFFFFFCSSCGTSIYLKFSSIIIHLTSFLNFLPRPILSLLLIQPHSLHDAFLLCPHRLYPLFIFLHMFMFMQNFHLL